MNAIKALFFLVAQVFVLFVGTMAAQQFDLAIEGSILMYDRTPDTYPHNFYTENSRNYVVKISRIIQGHESSEYILILTVRSFPRSTYDKNKTIRLNLTRMSSCDDKIRDQLNYSEASATKKARPRLIPSSGVTMKDVPLDTTLPCYLFRGNDYPNEWWRNGNGILLSNRIFS
jgi:hypothetical protein